MKSNLLLFFFLSFNFLFSQDLINGYDLIEKVNQDPIKNSLPKFNKEVDGVYKYLFEKLPELKKLKHDHFVRLSINEEGKVTYALVFRGDSSCEKHRNEIKACLLNMPAWSPAIYNSKPIEVRNYELEFANGSKVIKEAPMDRALTPPAETPTLQKPTEPEVYFAVDSMPEFPGGREKYMLFLEEAATKFEECKKAQDFKPCKLFFKFIVDEQGKCSFQELTTSLCQNCPDPETKLKLLVANMPSWKPGIHQGRRVKVTQTAVIRIK